MVVCRQVGRLTLGEMIVSKKFLNPIMYSQCHTRTFTDTDGEPTSNLCVFAKREVRNIEDLIHSYVTLSPFHSGHAYRWIVVLQALV